MRGCPELKNLIGITCERAMMNCFNCHCPQREEIFWPFAVYRFRFPDLFLYYFPHEYHGGDQENASNDKMQNFLVRIKDIHKNLPPNMKIRFPINVPPPIPAI